MKSSIFLNLCVLAAVQSTPIVINKNKGVVVRDETAQTNPLSVDTNINGDLKNPTSEDEYPRIHPILPLTRDDIPNSPTSEDEYPRIHPILPLTRDEVPNGPISEDEYPRIHPILPLTRDGVPNGPISVDEYPRVHPILPLTRDKVSNAENSATTDPPMKNQPQSVGLISIGNDNETPVIIKLPPGLSYNQAPSKLQVYNKEPIMQYEHMVADQESFMNQGVNLQNNYPIPNPMDPEQTGTQYQGQYNYSPVDTNVGGNQDVRYQQTSNPQYSYEYQYQNPQQDQPNYEYVQKVPASNYQQPYNTYSYDTPTVVYYTQSQDGYRPQVEKEIIFRVPSERPFRNIGSHIHSVIQKLVRPFIEVVRHNK